MKELAIIFPEIKSIGNMPIKLVSKEWAEKRQKENIPFWEGWIEKMPTRDYKHIIITLYNKSNNEFYEKFMYEN